VRRQWQYLRAVDWGAAFPLPSQAAVLGGGQRCLWHASSALRACVSRTCRCSQA
jgi:hypothetical protein